MSLRHAVFLTDRLNQVLRRVGNRQNAPVLYGRADGRSDCRCARTESA